MGKFWHLGFSAIVAAGCNDSTALRNPSDELGKREAAEAELSKTAGEAKPAKKDGEEEDEDGEEEDDKPSRSKGGRG